MLFLIGLGNPGKKYRRIRHNLGFLFLDFLAKKYKFLPFTFKKSLMAKVSEGRIRGKKVILVKPETFMNNSGKAVKKIVEKFNSKLENLLVIHDDLDFPLGKVKISKGKGSGGHQGVQSIIDQLKTKDFYRLRLGISPQGRPKNFEKFVLENFEKKEEKILKLEMERGLSEIYSKFDFET